MAFLPQDFGFGSDRLLLIFYEVSGMKTFMRDKMGDVRLNMHERCTFSMWLIVVSNQMFASSRIACKTLEKVFQITA